MKRYIKAGSIAQEILRIRDELDSGQSSSTTSDKEVAQMYKKSPKKSFRVKDNGDGTFSISLKSSVTAAEDDEIEDEWDPFHGHKYRINSTSTSGYGEINSYSVKYADTPVKAIQLWFQLGKNNPMDTAIITKTRDNAVELCRAATPEVIEKFYNNYGSCYELDYLIDEAAKQVENGCRYFYEDQYGYGDQIHPFCYG